MNRAETPCHPLADVGGLLGILSELPAVDLLVFELAVVDLRLLKQVDGFVGWFFESGQNAEEAGHLQRVWLDVDVRHVGVLQHLLVDVGLAFVLEHVGVVDPLGAVVERLHLLVAGFLAVLRHVRPADDHLIDIDPGVVFRLDRPLL
ncbi:MAG: hypothetical protein A07HN63_00480 [uncultured archaeon A07HN63]|nr:MAG: hypothetical protein A07HN63_00480 [uncultured archaeon A07HN63]